MAKASVACPALAFDPWDKQLAILQSPKEVRLLAWANRVGKSTIGACECVLAGEGAHPYIKYPAPPFTIWAVSNSYKQMEDSIMPAFEGDATHPRMLPAGVNINRQRMEYVLPSGSVIRLKTVESGRDAFQGAAIPLTWLDEDIDTVILKEIFSRIGPGYVRRILWSLTAVNGLNYAYNYLYLPWLEAKNNGQDHPTIEVSVASMDENPHLSPESIDSILKFFPKGSKEYKVRRYGGFENLAGDSVFGEDVIDRFMATVRQPEHYKLRWAGDGFGVQWKTVKPRMGDVSLAVWDRPSAGRVYTVGADVAEGKLSDLHDEDSARDYSTIVVYDRLTRQYVARLRCQLDAHSFGLWCWLVSAWYNNAWICPELNHNGTAVLGVLRGSVMLPQAQGLPYYPNIYARETDFDHYVEDINPDLVGWKTTTVTRPKMISDFYTLTSEGNCSIYDQLMVEEMRSFQRNKLGKAEHSSGFHDDILVAGMLALQADLQCPSFVARLLPITDGYVKQETLVGSFVGQVEDYDEDDDA
jgi:hypothetical protein